MPGNSEKRPGYVRVTRPPTYVNVPAAVAYAPVPDALVVTMIRILGLCWTNRFRHSPPLSTEELVRLLDRPRSTLQRHLDLLERELGWLRCERRDGRFVLYPCPPFSAQPHPEDLDPSPGTSVAGESGAAGPSGAAVAIEALGPAGSNAPDASVAGEPPGNDHARSQAPPPRPPFVPSCPRAAGGICYSWPLRLASGPHVPEFVSRKKVLVGIGTRPRPGAAAVGDGVVQGAGPPGTKRAARAS